MLQQAYAWGVQCQYAKEAKHLVLEVLEINDQITNVATALWKCIKIMRDNKNNKVDRRLACRYVDSPGLLALYLPSNDIFAYGSFSFALDLFRDTYYSLPPEAQVKKNLDGEGKCQSNDTGRWSTRTAQ